MKRALQILIASISFCSAASAQISELGRWQDLDYTAHDVHLRAGFQYQDLLVELASTNHLDDDTVLLKRAETIVTNMARAAISLKPESANWQWEVHTTSNPTVEALCMAGGKLLIGSEFVRRLQLDDGELAALIAHEMAHALADHHREMLSNVRRISPLPRASLDIIMLQLETDLTLQLRLSQLSVLQEQEADQLGMILVHRAGWPSPAMVRFYQKMAATDSPSAFSSSHPSSASRLSMAKGMARLLGN
ncbi:MAG: M48 family metalloprotease [Burkholderiales bacterium]|nr:M48 family metalloprotease [Burkholderiales bacterium]